MLPCELPRGIGVGVTGIGDENVMGSVCCPHIVVISQFAWLLLNGGEGVGSMKGEEPRASAKVYESMSCVGVVVKSKPLCKGKVESNMLPHRDGVCGIPWQSILGATVDFISKGKQFDGDDDGGVWKSNIICSLSNAPSKLICCWGVEFLEGGV